MNPHDPWEQVGDPTFLEQGVVSHTGMLPKHMSDAELKSALVKMHESWKLKYKDPPPTLVVHPDVISALGMAGLVDTLEEFSKDPLSKKVLGMSVYVTPAMQPDMVALVDGPTIPWWMKQQTPYTDNLMKAEEQKIIDAVVKPPVANAEGAPALTDAQKAAAMIGKLGESLKPLVGQWDTLKGQVGKLAKSMEPLTLSPAAHGALMKGAYDFEVSYDGSAVAHHVLSPMAVTEQWLMEDPHQSIYHEVLMSGEHVFTLVEQQPEADGYYMPTSPVEPVSRMVLTKFAAIELTNDEIKQTVKQALYEKCPGCGLGHGIGCRQVACLCPCEDAGAVVKANPEGGVAVKLGTTMVLGKGVHIFGKGPIKAVGGGWTGKRVTFQYDGEKWVEQLHFQQEQVEQYPLGYDD